MTESVFFSFHYKADSHRVARIKQIGALDGQTILTSNEWEKVEKAGTPAIEKYIADGMKGKKCLVVLVGEKTSGRKWINYEIDKAWNDGLGVVAVYIHNMEDLNGNQVSQGTDPFAGRTSVGEVHNPPYTTSANVYTYIKDNLPTWVDDAIKARKNP